MNTLRRIAILFFGVIFTVSLFMLVRILVQGRQEQAALIGFLPPWSCRRAQMDRTQSNPIMRL